MSDLTREKATEMVVELNNLPYMHLGNSAAFFSGSISWHPRWTLIFKLIKSVKEEYETLIALRERIQQAIANGEEYSFTDWGGGWEWHVRAVKVDGKTIRLVGGGACFYQGQHDRPVITL